MNEFFIPSRDEYEDALKQWATWQYRRHNNAGIRPWGPGEGWHTVRRDCSFVQAMRWTTNDQEWRAVRRKRPPTRKTRIIAMNAKEQWKELHRLERMGRALWWEATWGLRSFLVAMWHIGWVAASQRKDWEAQAFRIAQMSASCPPTVKPHDIVQEIIRRTRGQVTSWPER